MLLTEVDLYLPIDEQMLCQIIDGGADILEKIISSLNIPQIASLLLLQNFSEMKNKQSILPERFLAKSIDVLNSGMKKEGSSSINAEMVSVLNLKNIEKGYKLLSSLKIALLDEGAIRDQNYLTSEGKWDYTFNEKYKKKFQRSLVDVGAGKIQTLTAEQSRIYREIQAQTNDHIHVQGYAGTGKSSLIKNLISMLDDKGGKILILAERKTQIDALMSGISQMQGVYAKTFASLSYEMIPQDLTNRTKRYMWKKTSFHGVITDHEIIRHFGIKPSGKFSPHEIVKVIRRTLSGFCHSEDSTIQLSHIPNRDVGLLDETTKKVVLYFAVKLWEETLNPTSTNFKPSIHGYHRIKWGALHGCKIPARYTHILIDECHDLSKPMLQILDRSNQAVISLGDEYQNLRSCSQERSKDIRRREVIQSVRSGCLIENIVNPIIAIHPGKTKAPFHGNQLNSLEITYYDKAQVPDNPVAILVSGMWELFEWAQHVASKNLNICMLTNIDDLNKFVSGCIELRRRDIPSGHWELFRLRNWEEVRDRYHNNQSFQNIDRLLSKDYGYNDWEKTSAKFTQSNPNSYLLGRVEDVRNLEFQAVMITPEVVSPVWQTKRENIGAVGSAIYVAVTRAKHRLIVPEELRSWIEEISAS